MPTTLHLAARVAEELGGQQRERQARVGDHDPRHVDARPARRSATMAAAPAAIACGANAAPSAFSPRSATNTEPGVDAPRVVRHARARPSAATASASDDARSSNAHTCVAARAATRSTVMAPRHSRCRSSGRRASVEHDGGAGIDRRRRQPATGPRRARRRCSLRGAARAAPACAAPRARSGR